MDSGVPASAPVVLHVLEAVQAGGGTARHVVDVVRTTPGVVHEVAVPSRRPGWPGDPAAVAALGESAHRVHVVEMRRAPAHPQNLAALVRLRRLIAARRPAIVHGHSSVGGALARLAATRSGAVRVYTPNGIADSHVALTIERGLGRLTDVLVAVSPSEAAHARALGIGARLGIEVVPNGIAPEPAEPVVDLRAVLGVPPGVPLVGCVARLQAQKDPVAFVEVAAQVARRRPDAQFVLVGDGPLAAAVSAAAGRTELGTRWHRIDHVPDLAGSLGQLDVLVSCARFEGGPYAPLEAMRAGTPVVLTDVVGNRDVVEDGRSGLLVPPGDTAALANAVRGLLDDAEQRGRMAEAGRRRVRDDFDVRAQGTALAAVYQRALSTRR